MAGCDLTSDSDGDAPQDEVDHDERWSEVEVDGAPRVAGLVQLVRRCGCVRCRGAQGEGGAVEVQSKGGAGRRRTPEELPSTLRPASVPDATNLSAPAP